MFLCIRRTKITASKAHHLDAHNISDNSALMLWSMQDVTCHVRSTPRMSYLSLVHVRMQENSNDVDLGDETGDMQEGPLYQNHFW